MIKEKDLHAFLDRMEFNRLDELIPKFTAKIYKHGDYKKFAYGFRSLPYFHPSVIEFNRPEIIIGDTEDISTEERSELRNKLKLFQPWRKGPFNLFGIEIDAEWRSDIKWERLKNSISDLNGRKILDVGSGNGYHCWRMLGAGADFVMGIDPYLLSNVQFHVVNKYIRSEKVNLLPIKMEEFPGGTRFFDTVFSMGVLYHRKSPFEHLGELKSALKPGGELVLETLIIDGDENSILVPRDRYAKMRNVWFIPSVLALENWLKRAGFVNVRLIDVSLTTDEEQRKTEWMQWESLNDFLNPQNPSLTIEDYPAPKRAVFISNVPS